jgi:nucleotidyltransferase substrate binding protein (TIGR01987 family)
MSKFESLLPDFESAIQRLKEVLEKPKDEFIRDSAIKRFEIVFDMAWKTLKAYLEEKHNVQCVSPKTCFREAYNKNFITEYDTFWVELADKRNLTAHTYKEDLAEEVFAFLPKALEHFQKLDQHLRKG